MSSIRSGLLIALGGTCWLAAAVAGSFRMMQYERTPGSSGQPVHRRSDLGAGAASAEPAGHRLLLFVHPRCPCTAATIVGLRELLHKDPSATPITVYAYQPANGGPDWDEPRALVDLAGMPRVRVIRDIDGAEARRFGCATSGHVLLYDAGGGLRFSGGITLGRGVEGANPAREALLVALRGGAPESSPQFPVFGCPLFSPIEPDR